MAPDRPTRFAADLLESAAAEGARQNRSAKQQLDYWTRVGRSVSSHQTAPQRRIEAALSDTTLLTVLSPPERLVANAEIDAAIQQHAQATSYGARLAAEGLPIVAVNDDGHLVRYEPDGTSAVIG